MSKHHHHPHEGHRPGETPAAKKPGRGAFFYVSISFILIALLCFIVNGATFFRSPAATPPAAATPGK
jgi:hypothetical protein